jgi:hypothetical protein
MALRNGPTSHSHLLFNCLPQEAVRTVSQPDIGGPKRESPLLALATASGRVSRAAVKRVTRSEALGASVVEPRLR